MTDIVPIRPDQLAELKICSRSGSRSPRQSSTGCLPFSAGERASF